MALASNVPCLPLIQHSTHAFCAQTRYAHILSPTCTHSSVAPSLCSDKRSLTSFSHISSYHLPSFSFFLSFFLSSAPANLLSSSAPSTPQCAPPGPPACPPSSTPTHKQTSSASNFQPQNPLPQAARPSPLLQKRTWSISRIPARRSRTRLKERSRSGRWSSRARERWRGLAIGTRATRMRSARATMGR